jgi:hypothetical protein
LEASFLQQKIALRECTDVLLLTSQSNILETSNPRDIDVPAIARKMLTLAASTGGTQKSKPSRRDERGRYIDRWSAKRGRERLVTFE